MPGKRVVIVGGGAAGFFAAIAAAQAPERPHVILLERSSQFLSKVRISGGGRCNVTNVVTEPRALSLHYPRGERALVSGFHRFSSADTVDWFEKRGVPLKVEGDGRIFPQSDSSTSIIRCLVGEAEAAGVQLRLRQGVEKIDRIPGGGFRLVIPDTETIECDRLLLATGGCRSTAAGALAESLGHTLEPPVPSLFSFHADDSWLKHLPGVSVAEVEATVDGTRLSERGPLLITHHGLSGPAILRLSAWGARILHQLDYCFMLRLKWLPRLNEHQIAEAIAAGRERHPNKLVLNSPINPLPARLWERLAAAAGVSAETRWTTLTRAQAVALTRLLTNTEVKTTGKSLNKEEFVTCGGVKLKEIDFRTMQSRVTPNLFFAGELLDLDGITGGFNFQSAWTTGWIAGKAMANETHEK